MTVSEPAESYRVAVAEGIPELDQRFFAELDKVNAAATPGVAAARELES